MPLTAEQRRALRARGHALHPIVTLGERGLADTVVTELEAALEAHELIKVRLPAIDRDERARLAEQMLERTHAERVQSVGRIVLIYRERRRPRGKTVKKKLPARGTPGRRRPSSR